MDVFGRRTSTPRGASAPTSARGGLMRGSLAGFVFAVFFAAFSAAACSFAAFLAAAFSSAAFFFAAFLSVTSSLPPSFLELDPRRNTIFLLNLSLLEGPVDAPNRFVGRRLNDFDSAQILGAAE